MIPNRNFHAALAFAYFQAEAALDDDESSDICSDLFDKWGTAWEEMKLQTDEPTDE
jgi:hypothetical protein